MKWLLSGIRAALSPRWVNDTLALAGLGLLAWGFGWIYLPLAPLTVGAGLMTCAVVGAKKPFKEPPKEVDHG